MYLRFFKFLYFVPDESVRPWINKDYLLAYPFVDLGIVGIVPF